MHLWDGNAEREASVTRRKRGHPTRICLRSTNHGTNKNKAFTPKKLHEHVDN